MGMKLSVGGIFALVAVGGGAIVGLLEGLNLLPAALDAGVISLVLIFAGLLVGLMNIMPGEREKVIIAALGLGIGAGVLAGLPLVGGVLEAILARIAFVSVPIAIPPSVMLLLGVTNK